MHYMHKSRERIGLPSMQSSTSLLSSHLSPPHFSQTVAMSVLLANLRYAPLAFVRRLQSEHFEFEAVVHVSDTAQPSTTLQGVHRNSLPVLSVKLVGV